MLGMEVQKTFFLAAVSKDLVALNFFPLSPMTGSLSTYSLQIKKQTSKFLLGSRSSGLSSREKCCGYKPR